MSQAPQLSQWQFSSENCNLTLHSLCEEDFPFVLQWMKDDTALSFRAFFSQTEEHVTFLVGKLNDSERIGLMMAYPHFLTVLNSPYELSPSHSSIQVFFNYESANRSQLVCLVKKYLEHIFNTTHADTVLWEIENSELQSHIIASETGFNRKETGSKQFALYAFARE